MARAQTVFSELCVATAITGGNLQGIRNVNNESVSQFEEELKKRQTKDKQSIKELTDAGKKVKGWLQANHGSDQTTRARFCRPMHRRVRQARQIENTDRKNGRIVWRWHGVFLQ
jgi:hypothetical protein